MNGARWTDSDLNLLSLHDGRFHQSLTAEMLGRSENAVRVRAHRERKERQRVEAARKLRDVPRGTAGIAAS